MNSGKKKKKKKKKKNGRAKKKSPHPYFGFASGSFKEGAKIFLFF